MTSSTDASLSSSPLGSEHCFQVPDNISFESDDESDDLAPVGEALAAKVKLLQVQILTLRQELEIAQKEKAEVGQQFAQLQLGIDIAVVVPPVQLHQLSSSVNTQGMSPEKQQIFAILEKWMKLITDTKNRLAVVKAEIAQMQYQIANFRLIEIARGNPMVLFQPKDGQLLSDVEGALKGPKQNPVETYRLALFLANFAPERLARGTELYEELRTWMITRACKADEFEPGEENLREALLLAMAKDDNAIEEDLMTPLRRIAALRGVVSEAAGQQGAARNIAKAAVGNQDPLQWIRKTLLDPDHVLTPSEEAFLGVLYGRLEMIDEDEVPLPRPGNSPRAKELMTLQEQIEENPQFGITVTHSAVPGGILTGPEWQKNLATREDLIREAIKDCADLTNLLPQMLAMRADLEAPLDPKEADTRVIEQLEKYFSEGVKYAEKEGLLKAIEDDLAERIERLSGLRVPPHRRAEFAAVFFDSLVKGNIPHVLKRLLKQGDGSEELAVVQMLYYYSALKGFTNQKFQPAGLTVWSWMIPRSLPNEDQIGRLLTLVRQIKADDALKGSSLTESQVLWAESLYSNLTKGTNLQINEEPGSGKTVSVSFSLRLLQTIFPECRKKVHWICPFINPIDGLTPYLLMPEDDLQALEGPNFAGAADESHKLKPGLGVSPVHITATPIIPDLGDDAQRVRQLERLEKTQAELSDLLKRQKAKLQKAVDSATKEREAIVAEVRSKEAQLQALRKKLPPARQNRIHNYFGEGRDPVSPHDVLLCVNAVLRDDSYEIINRGLASAQVNAGKKNGAPLSEYWIGRSKKSTRKDKDLKPDVVRDLKALEKACIQLLLLKEARFEEPGFEIERDADSVSNIGQLQAQVQVLGLYEKELQDKIDAMQGKIQRRQKKPAYLADLPARKTAAFEAMDYQAREKLEFSPATAALMVQEGFDKQAPGKFVQLLFPGVRFSANTLDATLIAIAGKCATKPVRLIYRDSYSAPGSENYGDNMVVTVNADGAITQRETLQQFVAREGWKEDGQVVMLYDWTNQQGGDFGSLSRAYHADHGLPISIYLFHNLSNGATDPADVATSDDLFQGISRRRKPPLDQQQQPPVVFATPVDKQTFVGKTKQRQTYLEKQWAADQVAKRAAKKFYKAYHMRQGKMLRGRRINEVVGADHQTIVEELRKAILSLAPEDVANVEKMRVALRARVSFKEVIDDVLKAPGDDVDYKEDDLSNAPFKTDIWRQRKTIDGAVYLIQQAVRYQ